MTNLWENRDIDDLQRMCVGLIAEKKRLRALLENLAHACETKTQTQTEECLAIVIREELKIDLSIPFMPKTSTLTPSHCEGGDK